MSTSELEGPDPTLSSDAAHSTYEAAPPPEEPQNPPSGPSVLQTLGKPTEAAGKKTPASSSGKST